MLLLFLGLLLGRAAPTQAPALPADFPKLLTRTDLRQPNGRQINVHLVNITTIGVYLLNQHLLRRNRLTNEQQQAEEQEQATLMRRHPHFSWLADSGPDAERLAVLGGFASAASRRAVEQLVQQEGQLEKKEDPGFAQQSAADQRSAFEAINQDNRQSGRIDFVRLRSSWEQPIPLQE